MYMRDLISSLARRWYLVVAGLVATVGCSLLTLALVPVSYEASSSLVLLPPKSSVGARGNPYLYLGGLSQALEVLSVRLGSEPVRRNIEAGRPRSTYVAKPDDTTSGPILVVTGTGPTSGSATTIVAAVVKDVPKSLETLQDELSVPNPSRISTMILSVDSTATLDDKNRSRLTLLVAAAGVVGTCLLTGLLDGLLLSRRTGELKRRRAHQGLTTARGEEGPTPQTAANVHAHELRSHDRWDDAASGRHDGTDQRRGSAAEQAVSPARPNA
jgi:uncharacterized protein involved in exopolysaccharide biosynthesis